MRAATQEGEIRVHISCIHIVYTIPTETAYKVPHRTSKSIASWPQVFHKPFVHFVTEISSFSPQVPWYVSRKKEFREPPSREKKEVCFHCHRCALFLFRVFITEDTEVKETMFIGTVISESKPSSGCDSELVLTTL